MAFFYSSLIFCAIIILLISVNWSGIKDFGKILSAASIMTTLLLAVIAIIYSFITNQGQSSILGEISNSASELRNSVTSLNPIIEVSKSVGDLIEKIDDVSSRISNSACDISSVKDDIGTIKNTITHINNENPPTALHKHKITSDENNITINKDNLRKSLSVSTLIILYIACICCRKNIAINLKTVEEITLTEFYYMLGALTTMSALGVVEINRIDDNNVKITKIEHCELFTKEAIDEKINTVARTMARKEVEIHQYKLFMSKIMRKIDDEYSTEV